MLIRATGNEAFYSRSLAFIRGPIKKTYRAANEREWGIHFTQLKAGKCVCGAPGWGRRFRLPTFASAPILAGETACPTLITMRCQMHLAE